MSSNIFSLKSLEAWLESKDPREEYYYAEPKRCLLYQYFRDKGVPIRTVSPFFWRDTEYKIHPLPIDFDSIVLREPKTFGAALERTRKMQGDKIR